MTTQDALIVTRYPQEAPRLKETLSRYQINCQVVSSAEMALSAINGTLPDLLIVDLVLPGMSGWELVYTLRQKKHMEHSHPVIALTRYDGEGVQEAALAEGFTAYFPRPIDELRFEHILEQLVHPG